MKEAIAAVPTNIITGFLGVGKTSTILHLLKSKPDSERWAILVNEFGEIGIDGSLFEGQHSQKNGVYIKEVPGGCMCCMAGLPMQIALNQLLAQANPDRLLIEPTGLGHPKEVLQVLSDKHYETVLSLEKTLTLVDARKLSDERYTSNTTFNQQIEMADVIVANKIDLYKEADKKSLISYIKQQGHSEADVVFAQHGEVDTSYLKGSTGVQLKASCHNHHSDKDTLLASEIPIPECGFIKANNKSDGFSSVGWRFSPNKVFDYENLFAFLSGINAERMKAVFITDKGIFGYNLTSDALTEMKLDDCFESRIEIISEKLNDELEKQLLSCLTH